MVYVKEVKVFYFHAMEAHTEEHVASLSVKLTGSRH
jgi:hypothetical protein